MTDNDLPSSLRPNASDYGMAVLRAMGSAIDVQAPGYGSLFAEIAGVVIPNQRAERFAEYLAQLSRRLQDQQFLAAAHTARLSDLEAAVSAGKLFGPEQIALFEDGARASTKSTTTERIERFAAIVSKALSATELEAIQARELVALADQLSDADFSFLMRFVGPFGTENRPTSGAEWALERPMTGGDWAKLTPDEVKRAEQHRALIPHRRERLSSLGLLAKHPRNPTVVQGGARGAIAIPSAEPPVYKLSPLGAILLQQIV